MAVLDSDTLDDIVVKARARNQPSMLAAQNEELDVRIEL
jgi:hypothetical protein